MNRDKLTHLIYKDEGPKLDFKRQSWDLASEKGKGELLKDVLAMANAPGGTGYLVIGVGDQPSRPLEGVEGQDLSEEQLQQIIGSHIEPPVEFTYSVTELHGKFIGIVTIPPSRAKPHWAKKAIGTLRDHTFFTRRGSTTSLMDLSELERIFRERPLTPTEEHCDWSTDLLWNRKEHIRVVPCLFLQRWEQCASAVMATAEVRAGVEAKTGKRLAAQGAGNLMASFNQKAAQHGLPPLFVQVDDGVWRLREEYLELVKEFCSTCGLP